MELDYNPPGPRPGPNIPAGSNCCFTAFINASPSPIGPHTSTCGRRFGRALDDNRAAPADLQRIAKAVDDALLQLRFLGDAQQKHAGTGSPRGNVAALPGQPLDDGQRLGEFGRQHADLQQRTAIVVCETCVVLPELLFSRFRQRSRLVSVLRDQLRRGLRLLRDGRLDRFEPDDETQRMGRKLERGRRQVARRQLHRQRAEIGRRSTARR